MTVRIAVAISAMMLAASASGFPAPFRMLFWQAGDICDGRSVRLQANSFSPRRRSDLIRPNVARPSLWYMPSAAVPVGEDIRIYYQRVESRLPVFSEQRVWCMGLLRPKGFSLPDLKLYPQSWPGPANTVLTRSPHKPTWGGFNVFQMAPDPEGTWRVLYWDQPEVGEAGGMVASSADGVHWTLAPGRSAVFTEHNDAYSLVRNPSGDGWLLYQTRLEPWPDKPLRDNLPGLRRVISLRRSRDLTAWTPQETILCPDGEDAPGAEFYFLKAFRYADRYVGVIMKYYADPRLPGKHSGLYRMEVAFSSDGVRWERPYRSVDLGVWSYADPFVHRGDLCMVASRLGALSLYRMRMDGLASCEAIGEGSFCTRPFIVPADDVTLNADCRRGTVSVEVLDASGATIPGYEPERCRLGGNDSTCIPLRWDGRGLSTLAGRTVRLRFTLRSARIYALASKAEERSGR